MFMRRSILVLATVLSCCIASSADAAVRYNIVALDPLPVPPGEDPFGYQSFAYGINEHGVVVGESTLNTSGHIGQTRPVMWTGSSQPGELWDDQDFGGKGLAINRAGFVVGRYGSGSGIPLPGPGIPGGGAFIWDPTTRNFSDLGDLGGFRVEATGINESGKVVGSSENIELAPRAFIWDAVSGMHDLGTLGGNFSRGTAINNQGQVVGWSALADGNERAFLWDAKDGMQQLGVLSTAFGSGGRAFAINDLAQVVGDWNGPGGGPFIWDEMHGIRRLMSHTELQDLGYDFRPRDINSLSMIVGFGESVSGQPQAILWQEKIGARLLRDLVGSNCDCELWFAFSVNDAGQIVGYGRFNNDVRAFLATPIPEPATIKYVVCSLFLAGLLRWREMLVRS